MAANLPTTSQKIYYLAIYLRDWKPNGAAGGSTASVERPVRIELKGAPVVAQDVYYKPSTPNGYIQFSFLGSEFNTLNAAGLTSLLAESGYSGHGLMQVRKQDGHPFDATALLEDFHIYQENGNRWLFSAKVATFNEGLVSAPLSPFAN